MYSEKGTCQQYEKKGEQVPTKSELILYQTENGKTKIEVRLLDED